MPFRILAWELQTKLVREAKCVSGNFEEAGSRAGSQSFVRSTPSPVSTKPEPTPVSQSSAGPEIPSICFLHYHPEDSGAKSRRKNRLRAPASNRCAVVGVEEGLDSS